MSSKPHVAKAKARAMQQFKKGNMSEDDYKRVSALADKMLANKAEDSDDDRTELYVRSLGGGRNRRED